MQELAETVNPLFVVLVHGWTSVSDDLVWARLLGVVTGLVAVTMAHVVMRGLGGAHAAPGAMILLAASPFFVGVAATVSDAPLALAAAMSCIAAFLEFSKAGAKRWLAVWLVTALLCSITHAALLLVILVLNGAVLFYRRRLQQRQPLWWSVQLPVFAVFFLLNRGQLAVLGVPGWPAAVSAMPALVSVDGFAVAILLVLCLGGAWNCRDWRRDPRHGLLLLSAMAPLLAWMFYPGELSILLSLPALLVLASMGLRRYPQWIRQLLWSSLVAVYGADYWRMFGSG